MLTDMMTWPDLCADKRFQDLPFKIETNGRGQVLMSPTFFYHGNHAGRIHSILEQLLPEGMAVVECAIITSDGVREADVAWLSEALAEKMEDVYACPEAPEICVEILSQSNTVEEMMLKRQLFIAAGTKEYWLCDRKGRMRFFDGIMELPQSKLCPEFPRELPKRKFGKQAKGE